MLKKIIEAYPDLSILKADGLDEAVIGFCETSNRLIYDVSKCMDILAGQMTLPPEETEEDNVFDLAREYFDFNVRGAYVGSQTPIWAETDF